MANVFKIFPAQRYENNQSANSITYKEIALRKYEKFNHI